MDSASAPAPDGANSEPVKAKKFAPPTPEEAKLHGEKIGLPSWEVDKFLGYYESNGWRVGRNPMRSWHGAMANWRANWEGRGRPGANGNGAGNGSPTSRNDYRNSASHQRNASMGLSDDEIDAKGRYYAELARKRSAEVIYGLKPPTPQNDEHPQQ